MTALVEKRGLVEVRGVEKRFAMPSHFLSREKPLLHALNGVDAVVRQGEAFCVVGESGCGKTTLGRIVMGLTEPSNGEVHFDGTRIDNLSDIRISTERGSTTCRISAAVRSGRACRWCSRTPMLR